ncbi:MAG: ABC transporter permease [Fusobacteriaceae bacterium]|jgi:peptide/nickel transport system permease protein|nr:ABC transporter permease [Fusobacteriaceae bacterium]
MFYLKKFAKVVFSILLIGTLSFLLLELIPGDPANAILGIDSTPEEIEILRETLGLNKALIVRYLIWIKGVITGNFGNSFKYSEPVVDLIAGRLPLTLKIAFTSLIIVFLVSIPLSFILYKVKNKYIKKIGDFFIGVSISVPSFWLGIISMFVFGIILKILSIGYDRSFKSLLLPCCIIAVPKIGVITSFIKSNLEKEMREEYIKYLFVNGLKLKWLNIYIFKNSILSVIPLIGLMIIDLITGTIIIEQIFSIPGIGRLLITSVVNRDLPLIQGLIFYTSVVLVCINFIIDIIYALIDPRIREDN